MIWVLYMPEESAEPVILDTWIPFQMKKDLPDDIPAGKILCRPLLRFADTRTISPRKVMIRVGIGMAQEVWYPFSADIFIPETLQPDIQLLHQKQELRLPKEVGEKTFRIDEQIRSPEGGKCKIVYYYMDPVISEQKVLSNKIAFRGTANLHMLYIDEANKLYAEDYPISFSQYADLDASYGSGAQVRIVPCITELDLKETEGEGLTADGEILCQYLISDSQMIETVSDVYWPGRRTEPTIKEVNFPVVQQKIERTVSPNIHAAGKAAEIADVNVFADYPRGFLENGQNVFEISGIAQGLYYDETGVLRSFQSRWEGDAGSVPEGKDCVFDSVHADVISKPSSGEDEIVLNPEIHADAFVVEELLISMISGIENAQPEEPDPGRPSLILRKAGKDSLWEIAKQCGSTVERIQTANGLDKDPPADKMLLIPVL